MVRNWLRKLAQRNSSLSRKNSRSRHGFRPWVEPLEERALLATFNVTNLNDMGAGSLRQAILSANSTGGPDIIAFNIAQTPRTITLASGLPAITEAVTMDASNQPVRVEGASAGAGVNGLTINSSGSTIRGLTFNRFTGDGIRITGSNNIIGGTVGNQRNTLTNNGGAGVFVVSGTGNAIRGNWIELNTGLGIDLAPAGVTPNDPGDGDTGPNNLQNYPVLSDVVTSVDETQVTMMLNSTPNTTFNIDFYTSTSVDASGFGEGVTYRGAAQATTSPSGTVTFIITFTPGLAGGTYITSTATPVSGNHTSEFSNAVQVPGTLYQFGASNYNVNENGGTATVTVTRTGDTAAFGTVAYATSNGSALAGQDYTSASGTLNFTAGQTSATFTVPILDDSVYEGDETVTLTLSNPTGGGGLGSPNPGTLTIVDNEAPVPPSVVFASANSSFNEIGGRVTITVNRVASTAGTVTVNYAISGGTATGWSNYSTVPSNADYYSTSGTLTFAQGQTTATFTVNILEDAIEDPNETIIFSLSNPTGGAMIGTPAFHTLTLTDRPGFDVSARAQEMLELLNRMRSNPAAELPLLLNSGDPHVEAALTFWGVDRDLLMQQWASLTAAPALAWHPALYAAAYTHTLWLVAFDDQEHQFPGEPGLSQRISDAGYPSLSSAGENIYSYTENVFHGHAGLAIDWGPGPGGIQSPPGHRINMMSTNYREVGITVVDEIPGYMPMAPNDAGPLLVTQDFANRFGFGNPYLLGVVFNDANGNTFYNAGEGLGDVNVAISGPGGSFNTTTMTAGGYQIQVPAGTYTVTFSGGGLASPIVRNNVVVSPNTNQKLDITTTPNPGQFSLSSTTYGVNENGGQATVTVTRSGGNAGVATVVLATSNGTATAGSDYTAVNQTLTFTSGQSTQTVVIPIAEDAFHEGNETVNLTLSNPTGGATMATPTAAVLTITDNDSFRVFVLTPTNSGFIAEFNGVFNPAGINLYDVLTGGLGAADAALIGVATGTVRGSLVIDPAGNRVTFVRTGPVLANDNYTVTLRSAGNAFRSLVTGELLDGNNDGTPGGDYTNSFSVNSSAVAVSLPDFARGPDQAVDIPATSIGLPLRLSSSAGVTSVDVTIRYDPRFLSITAAEVASGLPAGATVTINTSTPGVAIISFDSPALGSGITDFVKLTATVPASAGLLYTEKHVLDLTSLSINGGAIQSRDDDAVHVVAYLGDTTGNARLNATDAQRALRVAVGLDAGYLAYQLADPVIISDITGNGNVNSFDATLILRESIGLHQSLIPLLPASAPTIVVSGPDPLLALPKNLRGRPGSLVTVPVNLLPSDGLETTNLALSFDIDQLEVVEVRRGSLTSDFDIFAVNTDAKEGTIRVGLGRSAGPISGRGEGSVVLITFRIKSNASAGRTIINLRENVDTTTTHLNEGGLDLNPDPTNEVGDPLDGVVTIRGLARAVDAFFSNAGTDVATALNPRAKRRST